MFKVSRDRTGLAALAGGGLVTVWAWPLDRLRGPIGFDPSWIAGLHLAAADGLRFGHDIAITYGPLGFLGFPQPYYGSTSGLAYLVVLGIVVGTSGLLVLSLARMMPLLVACIVAAVMARTFSWMLPWDVAVLGVFLGSAWLVSESTSGTRPMRWAVALCALAGAGLLTKMNNGVLIAILAGASALVVARPGARATDIGRSVLAGLAGFMLAWSWSGQQASDLPAFVASSAEIVLGYSAAMSSDLGLDMAWLYGSLALAVSALAWTAWRVTTGWSLPARLVLGAMSGLFLFFTFKTGFARMDHFTITFASLPVALAAFALHRRDRERWALALIVVMVAFVAGGRVPPVDLLLPGDSPTEFVDQMLDVAKVERRHGLPYQVRAATRTAYGLDARALAELEGHTVHIDPWEAGVAMAHPEITWRPLPVFQAYQAYTAHLDELNAAFLRSADAPERILRLLPGAIDGRNAWFESPAAKVAMVCAYEEIAAGIDWQVLGKVADRCGPIQEIASVNVAPGALIAVPEVPDGHLTLARIRLPGPSPLDVGRTLLFKPDPWKVQLNEGFENRLVPGTAVGPLLLTAPESLGYSEPFAVGSPVRTIRVLPPPGVVGEIGIDFLAGSLD